MKKLTQLLSVAIVTTLLYSCASSNQSAFQKRKYYDFKHPDTDIAFKSPAKHQANFIAAQQTSASDVNKTEQVRTTEPVQVSKVTAALTTLKKKRINRTIELPIVKENVPVLSQNSDSKKKISRVIENRSNANSSEVDQVVLVILAILLPPLAVYLKEDAVTSNFWIDLLLCFLFWVPGVIFAILVVCGAI